MLEINNIYLKVIDQTCMISVIYKYESNKTNMPNL